MDGIFERRYNSLQDVKHESRVRSWRSVPFIFGAFVIGYVFGGLNSGVVLAALMGLLALYRVVWPLSSLDRAFENAYKALKLHEQGTDSAASRRRIHRLLKSAYGLSLQQGDGLIKDAVELRNETWGVLRRAALPAALHGQLRHATLEAFCQILSSPSVEGIRLFKTEMKSQNYAEASIERSWRKWAEQIRSNPITRFVVALSGSLGVGFGISLAAGLLWASFIAHQSFVTFVNTNPVAIEAIFSLGGILTIGLFQSLKKL